MSFPSAMAILQIFTKASTPTPVTAPSMPTPATPVRTQEPLPPSVAQFNNWRGAAQPEPAAPRPAFGDPIHSEALQNTLGSLKPPLQVSPFRPSTVDPAGTLSPEVSLARDPIASGSDQNAIRRAHEVDATNLAARYRSAGRQLPTRPSDGSGALTGPRINRNNDPVGGVVSMAPPVDVGTAIDMARNNEHAPSTETVEAAPVLLTPRPEVYEPNGGEPQPRVTANPAASSSADHGTSYVPLAAALLLAFLLVRHGS